MIGFIRHMQTKKFILLNFKNGEKIISLPNFFYLVKLSLEGLLLSRALLRLTLHHKNMNDELFLKNMLLTGSLKN